ncbi:MAG: hypothetical protein E7639_03260 [Ruminococcaceae bacterium]|nr:hypothetical protein [Oscillospiraceae bacterium]
MREQLTGNLSMPIGGMVQGSEAVHDDNLYWLDESGKVLAARATRAMPLVGESFFAALQASVAERRALYRTLECGKQGLYLMQCGPVPVLILRYPYAADRTLLALIPNEPLLTVLRTPAAYFADACLMREVELSPISASREMPLCEKTYQMLTAWLLPYFRLCAKEGKRRERPAELMQWLMFRTARIANAVGVDVQYDFGSVGYAEVGEVLYETLFVNILSLTLAAHRAASEGALYISVIREGVAAPKLYARMQLKEPTVPSEIEVACQALAVRGIPYRVWQDPVRQGLLHAELGFCGAPLSKQGMRNHFGVFGP